MLFLLSLSSSFLAVLYHAMLISYKRECPGFGMGDEDLVWRHGCKMPLTGKRKHATLFSCYGLLIHYVEVFWNGNMFMK
jgi:hypothetical protein